MEFFRQLQKLDQILKIMILQNQEFTPKTRAVTNNELLSSDKRHLHLPTIPMTESEIALLQEHVRDLVSKIKSIKADFAR